jgi:hypothetical protein
MQKKRGVLWWSVIFLLLLVNLIVGFYDHNVSGLSVVLTLCVGIGVFIMTKIKPFERTKKACLFSAVIKKDINLVDFSKTDCIDLVIIKPGTYILERKFSPIGSRNDDYLFVKGTSWGRAEEYWRWEESVLLEELR